MRTSVIIFLTLIHLDLTAQFTHADTLRGSNGSSRSWWNVLHYDIRVKPDFRHKSIKGQVEILFSANSNGDKTMQIDLQQPMIIDKIIFENQNVKFSHEGNVWWVYLKDVQSQMYIDRREGGKGVTEKQQSINIYFHGIPVESINPPWDGGTIWAKDKKNNPWFTVACQGLGASVWFPCKDYQGDEPDLGSRLTITVPAALKAVANGKLVSSKKNADNTFDYSWSVKNPINNYNIIPYAGKYVNFNEIYKGEKGNLQMNYWVLNYNLEKAKKHFTDAPRTLKALEHWFGPYPFYEDGYKLVESPHLGMEHQSAIAYGNEYQFGYRNRGDLSGSGWGNKWDFIIIHETAHEWFGNNITSVDLADMWIDESFANYAETLFTEYYYGKKAATEYISGLRARILNDKPIIGPYGVNKEGSGDMYHKGGNMIHTIRQVINDDDKFRDILRGLNSTFFHQTVTSRQVEDYMSKRAGRDLSTVFDQYLRTTKIPLLEYSARNGKLRYRWNNCVKGFAMPVKVMLSKDEYTFIYPIENFQEIPFNGDRLIVDNNFYINTSRL